MTFDMKKLLSLAVALLLLSACNGFRTQCYEDDLAVPLAQDSEDSLFLSIRLEYAAGGLPQQVLEQINNAIVTQAFDLEEMPGTLEETAIRYRENLIDEFLGTGDITWEDRIDGSFSGDWKNWKNYTLGYYSFRGGAHGLQTISKTLFDKKTGAVVTEADLFADGYQEPVAALLQEEVKRSMEAEAPELLDLVILESVVPNGNISVGKEGVEWTFQPYEVGPYALGLVSATLAWDQLQAYLK